MRGWRPPAIAVDAAFALVLTVLYLPGATDDDGGLDLTTHVMDGHALELEDESFDLAGSQFGVMPFPDMARDIAELARITRRQGRVQRISELLDPSLEGSAGGGVVRIKRP